MISRSLSRRLDRLETSILPTSTTSDPVEIILKFYSPEKVVTGSMSLKVDLPAPPSPEKAGQAMKAIDRRLRRLQERRSSPQRSKPGQSEPDRARGEQRDCRRFGRTEITTECEVLRVDDGAVIHGNEAWQGRSGRPIKPLHSLAVGDVQVATGTERQINRSAQ